MTGSSRSALARSRSLHASTRSGLAVSASTIRNPSRASSTPSEEAVARRSAAPSAARYSSSSRKPPRAERCACAASPPASAVSASTCRYSIRSPTVPRRRSAAQACSSCAPIAARPSCAAARATARRTRNASSCHPAAASAAAACRPESIAVRADRAGRACGRQPQPDRAGAVELRAARAEPGGAPAGQRECADRIARQQRQPDRLERVVGIVGPPAAPDDLRALQRLQCLVHHASGGEHLGAQHFEVADAVRRDLLGSDHIQPRQGER